MIFSDENLTSTAQMDRHTTGIIFVVKKEFFSTRKCGGQSVMIRAAFSQKGKTDVAILDGRQSAQT